MKSAEDPVRPDGPALLLITALTSREKRHSRRMQTQEARRLLAHALRRQPRKSAPAGRRSLTFSVRDIARGLHIDRQDRNATRYRCRRGCLAGCKMSLRAITIYQLTGSLRRARARAGLAISPLAGGVPHQKLLKA